MKKLYYCIICTLFFTAGAEAQNKIFPDTFAVWTEYAESMEDPDFQSVVQNTYLMQGDTLINGNTYKVIYKLIEQYKTFKNGNINGPYDINMNKNNGWRVRAGGVRKDGMKLYYLSFTANATEQLAYDFGYQNGDSTLYFFVGEKRVHRDTLINNYRVLGIEKFTHSALGEDFIIQGMGCNRVILPIKPLFGAENMYVTSFCGDGIEYTAAQLGAGSWGAGNAEACKQKLPALLSTQKAEPGNTLFVYPNPVENVLTINNTAPHSAITISDITGKTIYTLQPAFGAATINMAGFLQGVYLLQISDGATVSVLKIVKQ